MKKDSISNSFLIVIFLVGLSLLLYPAASDYWNSMHQSRAVVEYVEQVTQLDTERYEQVLADASAYNERLLRNENRYWMSEEALADYATQLNVADNGVMGYVDIPAIDVLLPIYHGTEGSVLQVAVGHIEWSSLPVGGIGTHSVISGHRGLPRARLFTDLDKLVVGDRFILQVLDETLTYEVDQILIVLPDELEALQIEEGQDYCTLVTCTPYGINTHRLLVRGHRIANDDTTDLRVPADAMQIEPVVVAPIMAIPMLLVLVVWVLVYYRKPKSENTENTVEKNDESQKDSVEAINKV